MSYQTVDLSGVCDRNSLHDRLQESLTLPSWYGRNLDALYDALTDAPGPIHICFTAWKGMEEADPAHGADRGLAQDGKAAARGDPAFRLRTGA